MTRGVRVRSNAAIYYLPDGYRTEGKNVMGINAASEGSVRGFLRFADIDTAYCAVEDEQGAAAFAEAVSQAGRPLEVRSFSIRQPRMLASPGCLYLPGPGLSEFAWRRRQFGQRDFSLCGITHTTASATALDAMVDFAAAPIQPWDAVVCTSKAVHGMVETLLADQESYLRDRLGATQFTMPQLPIIPLGVDCETFAPNAAHRTAWRKKLGIADDDIAVLFVGRLSFHAKAHPIPMYQALAKAAEQCGRRFHLIQAGWFALELHEEMYRKSGQEICPAVNLIFLDGRDTHVRTTIWSAADIFTSLTDNIQETFGLTPIEAMASALPVVVSDWNGYRDTVRDGTDGFRIPTIMSPAPFGGDLAYQYGSGGINYDSYIGQAAQFISVDIESCANAYVRLATEPELRRRMGKQGRRRALDHYDWQVIIPAYQVLWSELEQIRASAPESVAHSGDGSARPARPDPFHAFAMYPTRTLEPTARILPTERGATWLDRIRQSPLVLIARDTIPTEEECRRILALLNQGAQTPAEITAHFPELRRPMIYRGLVWLHKYGLIGLNGDG